MAYTSTQVVVGGRSRTGTGAESCMKIPISPPLSPSNTWEKRSIMVHKVPVVAKLERKTKVAGFFAI